MKKLVLVICSILLTTFLLEAGTRIFLPQSDRFYTDNSASLTLKPGKSGMWYGQHPFQREFATKVDINAFGFRDVEYTKEKPVGMKRFIVIGDSFVEAFQVQPEETFFKVLERTLNAESPSGRYQVWGFGKSGLGMAEKRTLVEKSLGFGPDMLILHLNPTDLNDAIAMTSMRKESTSPVDAVFDVSHLARLLVRAQRFSFFDREKRLPPLTVPTGARADDSWRAVEDALGEIRSVAKGHDIPLVLFIEELVSVRGMCGKEDPLHARWDALIQAIHLPAVVMGAEVCPMQSDEDPIYFPLDRHWTVRGHAIAADKLFSFLTDYQ